MNSGRIIGSVIGNCLSVLGVVLNAEQMNTVESITSIVCMIIGLLITIISALVIPLIKWYKNAKKDGKIDEEEVNDLGEILQHGVNEIESQLPKDKEKKNEKN